MDWVVGWWSDVPPSALTGQVVFSLLSAADLDKYEDGLIVERIIGQYNVFVDQPDPGTVHLRIVVRPEDPTVGGTGYFSMGIQEFPQAEEPFLWHKVITCPAGVNSMSVLRHPEWSHLDVRVNRALNDLDRLLLIAEGGDLLAGVPGGGTPVRYRLQAWIRVLVKH